MKLISEILGMVFYILMIPVILVVTVVVIIFGKEFVINDEPDKTGLH